MYHAKTVQKIFMKSPWDDNPDEEQLRLIARVEKSSARLEAVNLEILTLAESFRGKTIDSILVKDDYEVGLDWLLKNLAGTVPR